MFSRVGRRTSRAVDEENPYWISFADMMAGLLIIFILASVVFIIQLRQTQKQLARRRVDVEQAIEALTRANQRRADLLDEIALNLQAQHITAHTSENKSVLRIPDEYLFFESSSYTIPVQKQAQVAAIGEVLYTALLKGTEHGRHQFLDTIFIEGHTDSRPARTLLLGNWGLSANRAISVWKFWTEEHEASRRLATLRNADGKLLFSVSGYAATRRVIAPDHTPDTRRKNRRIDLRFTVRQPEIKQYRGILNAF